jgi:hypothetical protein
VIPAAWMKQEPTVLVSILGLLGGILFFQGEEEFK